MIAVAAASLSASACGDPALTRQAEVNRLARVECYRQAGFASGETSPLPADGSMKRSPGRRTFADGDLRMLNPPGGWLEVFRSDTPEVAQSVAADSESWRTSGYTGARAVGRRVYTFQTPEPFVSDALDRCLLMP